MIASWILLLLMIHFCSACDIDSVNFEDFSLDTFSKDYYLRKPLIVRNHVLDKLSAASPLRNKDSFQKSGGKAVFKLSSDGNTNDFALGTELSLAEWSKKSHQRSQTGYSLNFNPLTEEKGLLSSFLLQIARKHRNTFGKAFFLLGVGHANTGVQFHEHSDAFFHLFWGKKRWFLYMDYPHGHPGSQLPIAQWIQEAMPSLQAFERPLMCTQHAGDLVYVPEGWFHGTLNLESSLGVSLQTAAKDIAMSGRDRFMKEMGVSNSDAVEGIHFPFLWSYHHTCEINPPPPPGKQLNAQIESCKEIVLQHPRYRPALHNLGGLYMQTGNVKEAKEWFARAYEVNPKHAHTAELYARVLAESGDYELCRRVLSRLATDYMDMSGSKVFQRAKEFMTELENHLRHREL